MTTNEPTPAERLAQAEVELREAERTVHALRDAHSHIRSAQIALSDLPAPTWVTLTHKVLELALSVASTDLAAAQLDRRTCDKVAANQWLALSVAEAEAQTGKDTAAENGAIL